MLGSRSGALIVWAALVVACGDATHESSPGVGSVATAEPGHLRVTIGRSSVTLDHRGWFGASPDAVVRTMPLVVDDELQVKGTQLSDALQEIAEAELARGGATDAVVEIDAAADVPAGTVAAVRMVLARVGRTDARYRLTASTQEVYATVDDVTFCACAAEVPLRGCVQPMVSLGARGAVVRLWPALAGPCRSAKRSASLHAGDVTGAIGRVTTVVGETGGCISVPRESGGIDAARVHEMLVRGYARAPGCPYSMVRATPDVRWSEVQEVLSFMALEQRWQPEWYVERDGVVEAAKACPATVTLSELPIVDGAQGPLLSPTPGCKR
ncbi:MAG: hypothetical protein AAF721_16785 [Myxococcota bacterium]